MNVGQRLTVTGLIGLTVGTIATFIYTYIDLKLTQSATRGSQELQALTQSKPQN